MWRQGSGLEIDKKVIFRDLLRYYQGTSIAATLLDGKSSDTVAHEPAIQIKGRHVDLVLLPELPDPVYIQRSHIVKHSEHVDTSTNRRIDVFHFIVKRLGNRSEHDLLAEMMEEKKGWIRKKLVGIRWEGGQLARLLNKDTTIRNMILTSQTCSLKVEPDSNNDCIRIIHTKQIKYIKKVKSGLSNFDPKKIEIEIRFEGFPSIETFDVVDRIAQHVQSL